MASATTLTASTTTPYATLLNVNEAGTAVGLETVDIIALLTAAGLTAANSPLMAGLTQAFANQAAAQAYLDQNIDLLTWVWDAAVTIPVGIRLNANVSAPAVANNFRLEVRGSKTNNADAYQTKVRFTLRHSIVR